MATFEELLNGRELHELTDEEIDEIVGKMNPDQLEETDKELKRASRGQKKAPTKNQQKNIDAFDKALFSGDKS